MTDLTSGSRMAPTQRKPSDPVGTSTQRGATNILRFPRAMHPPALFEVNSEDSDPQLFIQSNREFAIWCWLIALAVSLVFWLATLLFIVSLLVA